MEPAPQRERLLTVDSPILFVILAGAGLIVAFVFSFFTGPAPWYAWVVAAATLPTAALIAMFLLSKSGRDPCKKSGQ